MEYCVWWIIHRCWQGVGKEECNLMEHIASSSKSDLVSGVRIKLRSQGGVGFFTGRKVLIRPFKKLVVAGWVKIE